jgi:hypothetical protein
MGGIEVRGFTAGEEALVRRLHGRLKADGFALDELERIEKRDMPGYNGLVEPELPEGGTRLRTTLYLAVAAPFTIAHELAHASDIAVRHDETLDHIGAAMPMPWHMAHRMTSEYYANRIASLYCGDEEIFPAFQNDRIGMIAAAQAGDWAGALINYALLLGIFHGLGRLDVEPLELMPDPEILPEAALSGAAGFRREADIFFTHYAKPGKAIRSAALPA